MKVYCTKYALSKGITEHELVKETNGEHAVVKWENGLNGEKYLHRGEWHYTRSDAVKRAEEMLNARITSLQKQINKLGRMSF